MEIRPILSRHCFKCHGPDEGQRQGGLRLDLRDAALRPGAGGRRAILPGKPDASELVRRVFAATPARRMPPPHANKPLAPGREGPAEALDRRRRPYAPHWAFVAPRRPRVPAVRRKEWVRNPIDAFVLARLEREGIRPSPEADPYTLVRRVTLDLTGLPPTPEEADTFVREYEVVLCNPPYARIKGASG